MCIRDSTNTDKIVAEYAAAQERLHACLEQKDELSTTSAEQLAELSENYRIAMEGEGQDIPLLRTIYAVSYTHLPEMELTYNA